MLAAIRRWTVSQANASPIRAALLRYAGAVLATALAAAAFAAFPQPQAGGIAALVVMLVFAWFGGLGPAIVTPLLFVFGIRLLTGGPRALLEIPQSDLWALAGIIVLTTTVGWSGQVLRRSTAIARQQAARLREQARALSFAHVIFRDLDGRITTWNEGAQQLYGWSGCEAEAQIIHELLQTEFPQPLPQIVAELVRNGQWKGELIQARRDGARVVVASHWILYASEEGAGARVAEVNSDVTALRRAEESVREADRRKDRFLATLAHELRNPLAPIRTGLEVLARSDPAGDVRAQPKLVEIMLRQVDHLVRLIDDLLDLSRINTGKIELRRETVELAAVVHDAIESSRPHIDKAGHALTVELPESSVVLLADRARLAQVLLNILNNAAKFTPPGGQIDLSAAVDGDDVEIRVRDTGIGISAEMLPRVFDMFAQGENSLGRAHEGLGIGLSLVRTLVQMHGGTVEAQSPGAGRGSEFVVRLPRHAGRLLDHASPTPRAVSVPRLASQRILVVDDNPDAARSMAMMLRVQGHDCRTAFDGPEALALAAEFRPQVFILDIGMPVMNGCELAQRLRGDPNFGDALLIAITGWGLEEDRERSRAAGFDHHLVKPVSLDDLSGLLEGAFVGPAPAQALEARQALA